VDQRPVPMHAGRCRFCGWAADYERDGLSRLVGSCQRQAVAVLGPDSGDVLLDVGCGTGAAVRGAAGTVAVAVGADACPRMIERAQRLGAGLPRAGFVVAAAERLPFADEVFTALLCTAVLRHVSDRAAAVEELARVLRPGGRVVVGSFVPELDFASTGSTRRGARRAAAALMPHADLHLVSHRVCSSSLGSYLIACATKAYPADRGADHRSHGCHRRRRVWRYNAVS